MKVTVSPTGEIAVEISTVAEAVEFVAAVRTPTRTLNSDPADVDEVLAGLTAPLVDTWNALNANGSPATPKEIADMSGISAPNASWRLRKLLDSGVVERPQRGVYRVVK